MRWFLNYSPYGPCGSDKIASFLVEARVRYGIQIHLDCIARPCMIRRPSCERPLDHPCSHNVPFYADHINADGLLKLQSYGVSLFTFDKYVWTTLAALLNVQPEITRDREMEDPVFKQDLKEVVDVLMERLKQARMVGL